MTKRAKREPIVPRPDRVRRLEGTAFGWLAASIQRDGWLRVMTPEGIAAYAFLCLAADRAGVSFFRRERIGRELGLGDAEVHRALARLETLDLVAYRPFRPGAADGYRQVLAVPPGGPPQLLPAGLLRRLERIGDGPGGKP